MSDEHGPGMLLVIDDDRAARRMMRRLLERRGWQVTEAGDGRSGLESVRTTPPDAVLLDLRMPGELSGLDVARLLRAEDSTATLPIIVVSASSNLDVTTLVREHGCTAFVEKPVDIDELERVLAEHVVR